MSCYKSYIFHIIRVHIHTYNIRIRSPSSQRSLYRKHHKNITAKNKQHETALLFPLANWGSKCINLFHSSCRRQHHCAITDICHCIVHHCASKFPSKLQDTQLTQLTKLTERMGHVGFSITSLPKKFSASTSPRLGGSATLLSEGTRVAQICEGISRSVRSILITSCR